MQSSCEFESLHKRKNGMKCLCAIKNEREIRFGIDQNKEII